MKQHPAVVWEGELFSPGRLNAIASRRPWLTRNPWRILGLRMIMAGRNCYGFETQPTQVEQLEISLGAYVERLERSGFDHFVMLERKNHLRRIVSMLVSRRTSQWHLEAGEVAPLVPIELDVERLYLGRGHDTECRSLVAHLQREQETWQQLREILGRLSLLYLTYEDDLEVRPEIAFRRVCRFVGIEECPVAVRFARTNPYPLSDVLSNYAQVAQALSGTPFEWMVDS